MTATIAPYRQIPHLIARRETFTGNSMSARWTSYPSTGRLPDAEHDKLRAYLRENEGDVYVVYSYGTPIAWGNESSLYVPDVRYSATTSRQQAICRRSHQ